MEETLTCSDGEWNSAIRTDGDGIQIRFVLGEQTHFQSGVDSEVLRYMTELTNVHLLRRLAQRGVGLEVPRGIPAIRLTLAVEQ
ncbi:MAG: hypothetical protein V8S34_02430 [Lawsonibacter sp.]